MCLHGLCEFAIDKDGGFVGAQPHALCSPMHDGDMIPSAFFKARCLLEPDAGNNARCVTHVCLQYETACIFFQVCHQEASLCIIICAEERGVAIWIVLVHAYPRSEGVAATLGYGW